MPTWVSKFLPALIYKAECLHVCDRVNLSFTNKIGSLTFYLHMIHILNQHYPGSALVHNSCTYTEKLLFYASFEVKNSKLVVHISSAMLNKKLS